MLRTLKRLLGGERASPPARQAGQALGGGLAAAREADIQRFLDAACRADERNQAPWVLRDEARIETLRRSLEFTLHRGLWLQREAQGVAHWQGRLLALRHADGPPLGMLLACRPDDEAAWQLRFFYIEPEWQGSGHGARLLMAVRRSLSGSPLQVRLPVSCKAAINSLEAAGFQHMHIDATQVASFEAPAEWH